ncbi:MAG: undecaprenyldiphospho-muramoylpentapeptide beta-N-acetylglucosaminyltransferase [Bacteroidota bacterium]|nr:undecaprenyldiphospho-muramoylpentapeptide beta-N-acetylglucosaminyltransferase [Bacteroidota bacterium]
MRKLKVQNHIRKYLFAGGGTGGHLFPALAIADELKKLDTNAEFLFVGTKNKIEARIVPQRGYRFETIWISGFQRSLQLQNLLFPFKVIISLLQSFNIINQYKPSIVIGTGGYVSGPILLAASIAGIKTILHESNSYPGAVTRFLSKRMTKVFITFDATKKWLKLSNNIEMTGNPTRNELGTISKSDGVKYFGLFDSRKTLLVFGGSLGAASINTALMNMIKTILNSNIQIIWQTGESDFERVKSKLNELEINSSDGIWIGKFIDKMEYAYASADVVLSRAGATTLAEITRLGKAVILIPYPHAVADHQTINARTLEEAGAALMIQDSELMNEAEKLILSLMNNDHLRAEMNKKCLGLGKPDAGKIIASKIIKMVN